MKKKQNFPNYRVAVEGVFLKNNKIFICKRAENCTVAPGRWNVPAGKVKYTEIPNDAIIREMEEETKTTIQDFQCINQRAFESLMESNEKMYRLVFTYLITKWAGNIVLDEEHSEGKWVTKTQLAHNYENMNTELKEILFKIWEQYK